MQDRTIGVVFLARCADGQREFERFAASYRRHAAGVDHRLIVIYKGFGTASELVKAREVFHDIPHIGLETPDIGFDIGSYLEAANREPHDYFCFLNTHTEIVAGGWLARLFDYASREGVGIVGATGSYESLMQSWQYIHSFYWRYYVNGLPYGDRIASHYAKFTEYLGGAPDRHDISITGVRSLWRVTLRHIRARYRFHRYWESLLTRPESDYRVIAAFPPFPNPHIRSTGFMLHREQLRLLDRGPITTKDDACLIESGPRGMTTLIRQAGMRAIVVGRDGVGYDVPNWSRSETFRLGMQSNLLLADNHSRAFASMSPASRETHSRMTWGDYLGPPAPTFPTLGMSFPKRPLT